jgi:hypothetical protein
MAENLLGLSRVHVIQGGLGNQMYQHAHAMALCLLDGTNAAIDISRCRRTGPYLGYEIDRVFSMDGAVPTSRKVLSGLLYRLMRRTGDVSDEGDDVRFNPAFLSPGIRGYVKGFFPSFRYFSTPEAERRVRKAFRFRQPLPGRHARLRYELLDGESVAVHIRRGDYLIGDHARAFMGICTSAYYHAAMSMVRRQRPSARFYFFSDDPAWCRETFGADATLVMDGNDGEEAWVDMALMSCCRHAIIANSSFSWWGRWLGGYDGAICIGPSRMMNDPRTLSSVDDFLPPCFTQIDPSGTVVRKGQSPQ